MAPRDVDIGDGCRRIERAQENSTNGHWVQDVIENVNPFSSSKAHYFERTFNFSCPEMPTSFHFRVTFTRSDGKGVTSVASMKRTDQRAGLVKVTLATTVRRAGSNEAYVKQSFPGLEAGQVGRDASKIELHQNAEILQRARNLLLDFVLTVEHCHSEKEEEEAMDTRDSEDSSPKKRICVQSSS